MQREATSQELKDVIEDMAVRFLLNLPDSEKRPERIFHTMEEAFWFYQDFYVANKAGNLKFREMNDYDFYRQLFACCDFLAPYSDNFKAHYDRFRAYQRQIPRFGAVLLNKDMTKVLTVVTYVSESYDFPKGKVNEGEEDHECAAREVMEETGFDIRGLLREEEHVKVETQAGTVVKLYFVGGISEDVQFRTHTRYEIKGFKWLSISHLLHVLADQGNRKYRIIRQFVYPIVKHIACKREGKSLPESDREILLSEDEEEETRNLDYYAKACKMHF